MTVLEHLLVTSVIDNSEE